ncbi:M20/M25/M40 family metallo-hydrolase, partial [Undibacterium sp.]|uniref:M20/M25/M40 family metallo-hydrolase n=1 Tax=Undibacterium sp. TaxID=1914977 RepID=UPI002C4D8E7D
MKFPRQSAVCVTALFSALIAPAASHAADAALEAKITARKPEIEKIVAEISATRIEATINKLVGFHTRHTMSETQSDTTGIGAARRWIKGELERCGAGKLDVQFDSHIEPAGKRLTGPTEIVNVVATLKGDISSDRYYVVSGHYDSRVTDVMDATSFAPGANDDASGTAAVMEMACVMARHKFDANIVFMAVAAEEQGLYGSAHFAQQAREKNLDIAGMFTNDIIGSSRSDSGHVDNKQVRLFAEG